MDTWLKALVGAACVVVIAGGGFMAAQTYSAYRDRVEKEEAAASVARSQDLSVLALDGCRSRVDDLMEINSKTPIKSKRDVPAKLAQDLATCIKQNIMYPYEKREMEDAALLGIFST
ncbi:hypothetical protein Rleg10DRAFT_5800 [Rhizobium leguminosarum bv. trifolii WSM2012]|nr:hypothetical protein Rleg10DRAFT_4186 [Rhizobium leguminosarum bv. trifolii WSM2012]EJC77106.1 hypothetical protein Rleg10DRAFT_5800 [Rhizobium leguminosarum bv. trifolii WSM2012]